MERNLLIPAFALYILATIVYLVRYRRIGISLFGAGAVLNFTAIGYRWIDAGHLPFSNMFETMMTLGACMFLLFLLTEYGFKSQTGWIESFLAAVIVFPSCFIFEDQIKHLPPALQSALFFPHVMTYLFAYAAFGKGFILSVISLVKRGGQDWISFEKVAYRVSAVGLPLLTAGLLLGGYWAKLAWGDYWSWDPKEVWSLNTLIIYLLYFHVRIKTRGRSSWVDILNIMGFLAIVITLLAVNLAGIFGGGLHSYA